MKLYLRKMPGGQLIPDDDDAVEGLQKIKAGKVVSAEIVQIRNYEFHKKFFALIGIAFDLWSDTAEMPVYKGQRVQPNKTRFRKDITILAGYGYPVSDVNGNVHMEAESISFANMDAERFEEVYSSVIDVILTKVLARSGLTETALREQVDRVMGFA